MTLPLFDEADAVDVRPELPPVYGAADHIPIETLSRADLLDRLEAMSFEAAVMTGLTRSVVMAEFLSRVVLLIEQTRVHLGGREP